MTISVRLPQGPFRRIWLPIPSLVVYLTAWVARVAVRFVRWDRIERKGRTIPMDPARIGALVTRAAWVLLCSGPYTLCDVHVQSEGVHVRITLW